MTTRQELERILEVGAELDPAAVSAEVSLMTGARLRSANLDGAGGGRGGGGGDAPVGFDKVDRWARGKHKAYRARLATALRALEDALFIQGELLVRMCDERGAPNDEARRLAAEAVSPQAEECANCRVVVERTATDRLREGRCGACYKYRRRTGQERPRELWAGASGSGRVAA